MLSIELIAIGKLKNDPLLEVFDDYRKRLQWKFTLTELEGRTQADEHARILERLKPNAALVMMDERGKSIPSRDFASRMDAFATSHGHVQFIIGGADGLSDELRKKATMLLSFGAQTWPHMLARTMLMEQIYRAQQILAGHPYHRD